MRRPASFCPVRLLRVAVMAGVLSATLNACVPLVVGGAAVGSAMLALDRRTSGAQLDDQGIELRGKNRISTALGDRGRVSVTSFNRIALLTGQAPNEADRASAEAIARDLPNVRSVVNEITVGPNATLTQRSADTLTSSKIKAQLIGTKTIQSNDFKVVTELGTVYLMGIVSNREADVAANAARDINGVLKVVKVFEIVGEDTLNNTAPLRTAAPAASPAAPAASAATMGATTP